MMTDAALPPYCEVHGCRGRWDADQPHTLCGKTTTAACRACAVGDCQTCLNVYDDTIPCDCNHAPTTTAAPRPDGSYIAGLREARAVVERQTNLADLVHFDRPSDFRKGVLTCLVALDDAIRRAESGD